MEEIWKDIDGYDGIYQVSSLGRIRSKWSGSHSAFGNKYKILKGSIGRNGYITISLCNDGKVAKKTLHRLAACAFLPKVKDKNFIDHIDCCRTNNNINNLRWVSQKENNNNPITLHRITLANRARAKRGSENPNATKVYQYSLDKQLITSFGSIIEASKETNVSYKKIIHNILGEQKTADGYIFSKTLI